MGTGCSAADNDDAVTPTTQTPAAVVTTSTNAAVTSTTGQLASPTTFSMADVAKHHDASDCWTAIDGSVYNVTSWVNQHPGGSDAIISLCGIDGSSAFNDQHGGQRRPANELAGFKIGTLK